LPGGIIEELDLGIAVAAAIGKNAAPVVMTDDAMPQASPASGAAGLNRV
jgi:hypothetical protein